MIELKDMNVLLTGGSRGLGPHIASALAKEGCNIAITARSEKLLKSVAEELLQYGTKIEFYLCNVSDDDDRRKLINDVRADFGRIDILVNNAGIENVSSYTDLSSETIDDMVQTNLLAPMQLAHLVIPDMLAHQCGHLVTMSSLGGKKGSPYSATYAATKAGLIQWSNGIRAEFHRSGVSASVICPGLVSDSGMFVKYDKKAPGLLGESKPGHVAQAVVKAIKKDVGEVIVNPGPIRLSMVLDAINPEIMNWILRKFGIHEFYRTQAEDNKLL